jgi:hypothetical protein
LQNLQDVFFLQTNGSGVLSFSSVSSDFVKLAEVSSTNFYSASFDGYFSSTYDSYQIHFYNLGFVGTRSLYVRFRVSNAEVTSNYRYGVCSNPYFDVNGSVNATSSQSSWSTSFIKIHDADLGTGTDNYQTQGILYLQNPLNTSTYKMCMGDFAYMGADTNIMKRDSFVGANFNATTALSGITFYLSSDYFTKATFVLYGIKR